MTTIDALGEALPREMARVRDVVLPHYLLMADRPRASDAAFMREVAFMRLDLHMAAKALAEGDFVAMLRAYNSLKEWEP